MNRQQPPLNMGTVQRASIELVSFVMAEVPMTHNVHFRPYETRADAESIQALDSATKGGTAVSPLALAGVVGKIIAPATQSKGVLTVPGGWQSKRMSVTATFILRDAFGNQKRETLQAYTDHVGVAGQSGALAPNMRLFFGTHTSATPVRRGAQMVYGQSASSHVMAPVAYVNTNKTQCIANQPMRPKDAMASAEIRMMGGMPSNHMDARTTMLGGCTPSRVVNASPAHYLERTMNTYRAAVSTNMQGNEAGDLYNVQTAAEAPTLSEDLVEASPLFAAIKAASQFDTNHSVTIAEFRAAFPNLDAVKHINLIGKSGVSDLTQYNQHLGGSNVATSISTMISQALPALMKSLNVGIFGFVVDNHARLGDPNARAGVFNVVTTNFQLTMALTDESQRKVVLEENLRTLIAPQIVAYGVSDFVVSGTINLMGSCSLGISINGGNPIPYSTPMYTAVTPVVGATGLALETVSNDITALMANTIKTPAAVDSAYPTF